MKKIAVGTMIALTAVLMIAAVPVYAQDGTPPDMPEGRGRAGRWAGAEHPFGGEPLEALAERLGMTVEELQAELDAGKTPRDLMEEAGIEPGRLERPFNGAPLEELAEQLGMTVEELRAELEAGSTPHDLLEAAGIEPDCEGVPLGGELQGKWSE